MCYCSTARNIWWILFIFDAAINLNKQSNGCAQQSSWWMYFTCEAILKCDYNIIVYQHILKVSGWLIPTLEINNLWLDFKKTIDHNKKKMDDFKFSRGCIKWGNLLLKSCQEVLPLTPKHCISYVAWTNTHVYTIFEMQFSIITLCMKSKIAFFIAPLKFGHG